MIRVGVIGAYGKMGREVCRAVAEDPECVLVAAVDVNGSGQQIGPLIGHADLNVPIFDELEALTDAEVDVAIDFTHPDSVMDDVRWCVRHAVHVVVGTTGISSADLDEIRALIEEEGSESNVFVAPNFAIGAVLMMRFSAAASKFMPSVEIIELHHSKKADAPSGTAVKTAEEIAKARAEGGEDTTGTELAPGARGAEVAGIRVHSVRLPGLVAHQEVILAGPGQSLTIRHDSYDRASFMPGVLLAVKNITKHPGLTYGLENLLDI
ncbi:MAG: 4-hydroxy-tetrahydrodipicolinate reductase [Actinomycetota bacterium]